MSEPLLPPKNTSLISEVKQYLGPQEVATIERAYEVANRAHEAMGQRRGNGQPYIVHCLATATTLAQMRLDAHTIEAALLHDVPEDTAVTIEEIRSQFGPEVAKLVDGVTKLKRLTKEDGDALGQRWETLEEQKAESLRKMFLAMAEDVRVVLIKLADRLHNMQTLDDVPPEKQMRVARETMDIYAPLANRLGIWQIKWQLEDLAFRHLNPTKYHEIADLLNARRQTREQHLQKAITTLSKALTEANITAELSGRPKHIYSIYRKMERKRREFGEIYDILAIRAIVPEVRDCYATLGIVHTLWRPIPGEFDDYISMPKDNLYQSLHTAVIADGTPLEVQIRTADMHRVAEYGIAAHWRYKEETGPSRDPDFDKKITWLRQFLELRREASNAQEFVDFLTTDVFKDQVYVFTPKNDVIDLPAGATPIDFAYRIHTEVGHACRGAKVNDRIVPLDYQLKTGDRVEIITQKGPGVGPSRDWCNPNLGFVKTANARSKILQYFRKLERDENIASGRELLEKELKTYNLDREFEAVIHIVETYPAQSNDRLNPRWVDDLHRFGFPRPQAERIADFFRGYPHRDDLYLAIGTGEVQSSQVIQRLLVMEESPVAIPQKATPTKAVTGFQIMGRDGMLSRIAACCNPVPREPIIGYVTRGRGVTIHRQDCPQIAQMRGKADEARLVPVSWSASTQQYYRVPIRVDGIDRPGLLRDIADLVADDHINLAAASVVTRRNNTATITATLEVNSPEQLATVITRLKRIAGVFEVTRLTGRPRNGK